MYGVVESVSASYKYLLYVYIECSFFFLFSLNSRNNVKKKTQMCVCLCVCVYIYPLYISIYIYTYTHIHIHIHICIYTFRGRGSYSLHCLMYIRIYRVYICIYRYDIQHTQPYDLGIIIIVVACRLKSMEKKTRKKKMKNPVSLTHEERNARFAVSIREVMKGMNVGKRLTIQPYYECY